MIRDIAKTSELDKTGPDVQLYQRYDVIPDTRSFHHNEDKAGFESDKNPWVPLPRISGDRSPGLVIGSSHPKSPKSSGLSGGLSSSWLRSPKRPLLPPPLYRHHLKVPLRPLSVSGPASDYQRKVRGKLGQNPAKRNRRQPKRLKDSLRRSGVKRRPADKIDIGSRTKISSAMALSAVAILLAL